MTDRIGQRFLAAAVLCFALFMGAALVVAASGEYPTAKSTPNHYDLDQQTAAFRTNRSGVDATAIATLTSTTTGRIGFLGRKTVSVGGRAAVSGATITVTLLYLNGTTFKGLATGQILTAGTITDAAGRYVAPDVYFDSGGAEFGYLVVTTASSSGVFDFWVGTN